MNSFMRKLILKGFFLLIVFVLPVTGIEAQMSESDSSVYKAAVDNAISSYHEFFAPEAGVYNGIEYVPYLLPFSEGHPFFQFDHYDTGSILYDGVLYNNVRMLFDLAQDVLVIDPPFHTSAIQLFNDKVQAFVLFGHNFVRIAGDSANHAQLATGFYEVMYRGSSILLRKDAKNIQQSVVYDGLQVFVKEKVSYYLKKNGIYYPVNNKKELLIVLADAKKNIRQFIRKNKINLRRDMDNALIRIVAFYDGMPR
jgi:hypothetical protein